MSWFLSKAAADNDILHGTNSWFISYWLVWCQSRGLTRVFTPYSSTSPPSPFWHSFMAKSSISQVDQRKFRLLWTQCSRAWPGQGCHKGFSWCALHILGNPGPDSWLCPWTCRIQRDFVIVLEFRFHRISSWPSAADLPFQDRDSLIRNSPPLLNTTLYRVSHQNLVSFLQLLWSCRRTKLLKSSRWDSFRFHPWKMSKKMSALWARAKWNAQRSLITSCHKSRWVRGNPVRCSSLFFLSDWICML